MSRIQISIPDETLDRIDRYAAAASLSRSAFFAMAASEYINAKEKAPLISGAFESMATLVNARVKGEITQEDFETRLAGIQLPK